MEYPLYLAMIDFLPVFFTAIGFLSIIYFVSSVLPTQGRIAFLGGLLVVVGGFFKAVWKLLMALSLGGRNIHWMEEGLFVFMGPGYVLFAWSIWQVARSVQGKQIFHTWWIPSAISAMLLMTSYALFHLNPASPAWERILLSMTVIANILSGIYLITFAVRQKRSLAGWLFVMNLVGIFILNGLARLPEQPIHLQWVEEAINAGSWLAFAIAAGILYRYSRQSFGIKTRTSRVFSS